MKLKRLTPEDFARVASRTRLGERARDMARAVLVDGRAQADVATEYGMTKQRVNAAVGAIERAYIQTAAPGTGWVSVALDLPEALALELASLVDALRGARDEAARTKALAQVTRAIRAAKNALA
jgi:hypothetical protein